jgi:hypothetical protein
MADPPTRLTRQSRDLRPSRASVGSWDPKRVFVRDFIEIGQPFEAVAPRLVRDAAWLDPIARDAVEETVATMGAIRPDHPVHRGLSPLTVRCTRGPVRIRGGALVMPLSWETNLPTAVLPCLDGDLEVVPLGAGRSQIALSATNGASSGHRDDGTRRAVESGLRVFLRQLAAQLEVVL